MEDASQSLRAPVGRGRRLLVGLAVVTAVAVGAALVADALVAGPLEPRDPSSPDVGVLVGAVAEVPPEDGPQRPVELVFTRDGVQHRVATQQGGAFSLELPPGTYAVSAASGQGVCPSQVVVRAGSWQRNDVLWPCSTDGPLGGGLPPPGREPA